MWNKLLGDEIDGAVLTKKIKFFRQITNTDTEKSVFLHSGISSS